MSPALQETGAQQNVAIAHSSSGQQMCSLMLAIGPKQTSAGALHMSAFGGKADMAI
jgi:hypothetical protein